MKRRFGASSLRFLGLFEADVGLVINVLAVRRPLDHRILQPRQHGFAVLGNTFVLINQIQL